MRGYARLDQFSQCRESLGRRCGPGFEQAGKARIKRGYRNRNRRQIVPRQFCQQVQIVQHAIGFGGDCYRMARLQAHFEHLPCDPIAPLDRLVGIGIGPHRDRCGLVAWFGQRCAQQFGGVGLGEQPGFKVQSRRKIVEGMGRARVTIDAAVLAAAIGIDRAVEGDVGRTVEAEDGFRAFFCHRGAKLGWGAIQGLHMVAPVAI